MTTRHTDATWAAARSMTDTPGERLAFAKERLEAGERTRAKFYAASAAAEAGACTVRWLDADDTLAEAIRIVLSAGPCGDGYKALIRGR